MSSKYLQALLLLIFFTSCKNEPKEKEIPLEFQYTSVIKKSGEGCLPETFECTVISIDVPVAEGPEKIAEAINSELEQHVFSLVFSEEPSKAKSYEEYAKDFISNQQKTAKEFNESIPWRAIIAGEVLFESDNLISIGVNSEIFTGGAHGYSSTSFLNFDPATGEMLDHSDIFKDDFVSFAEKAFSEQNNIPAGDPINSTGFWFEDEIFRLPGNIGFKANKVVLIYNSYEIASYAEGDFRMEFPLNEVKPYLKL